MITYSKKEKERKVNMQKINLTESLSIKKLNPNNPLDVLLIEELEQDKEISGDKGYLGSLMSEIKNKKHLYHEKLYNSSYIIYHQRYPIGYLKISPMFMYEGENMVDISYAIHKEARHKGYMYQTLESVVDTLYDTYSEIENIMLLIDYKNKASRNVARHAGFISDGLTEEENKEREYVIYQKTRK